MKNWIKICMSRLRHRENLWESERMKQWNTRQNVIHRFANGQSVEIKLTDRRGKPWTRLN